jgi:hypothetical protein
MRSRFAYCDQPLPQPPSTSAFHIKGEFYRQLALCVAEWWSLVTVPFVQVPLSADGARDVRVEWRITTTGLQQGVAVGEVVWDVRWATAPARGASAPASSTS